MIFAVDLSSRLGGIALLSESGEVVAVQEWEDASARHLAFWPALRRLVAESIPDWSTIRLFAAGRGPGSYSGLRAALTAVRMLAAPGGQPIRAVSSAAATALEWWEKSSGTPSRVVVAGDARRGCVWYAEFEPVPGGVVRVGEYRVIPAAEFRDIASRATVISSEPERLAHSAAIPSASIITAYPTAKSVGRLARSAAHEEPWEPLYLHPPV